MKFTEMARLAGLPERGLYTVADVSRASGISVYVLHAERRAGRLRALLPGGRVRGALIRPEWVDEWIDANS